MKKIAVNTVKNFLKENKRENTFTQTFEVGDNTFDVTFRTALSVMEKSVFLNRVVSGCFDMTGKYRPEYVSPMLRATIIQMCTNIPAMTLKNESDSEGAPVLDIDGMNELYLTMDLDNIQNDDYQAMLHEMVYLSTQAIDWKRSSVLADHGTDSALRNLLNSLSAKVQSLDMDSLMKYAAVLSESTKNLDEGGILQGLINAKAQ